jgi:hypothetical protein
MSSQQGGACPHMGPAVPLPVRTSAEGARSKAVAATWDGYACPRATSSATDPTS